MALTGHLAHLSLKKALEIIEHDPVGSVRNEISAAMAARQTIEQDQRFVPLEVQSDR